MMRACCVAPRFEVVCFLSKKTDKKVYPITI